MRDKVCKDLRRVAKEIGNPSKDYLARRVTRLNGQYSIQIINDPQSVRGIYRQLKRDYRSKKNLFK
ncbi:MAG: hypothetical protein GTO02_20910 [Candidatus Dadabacteria bacterium]|nr:hypothetical protein [Candidatus Dadabacteria bacterium]